LALLNKLNVGYLAIGVAAGLAICRRWSLLRSWWVAAGAVAAAVIFSPDLAWNATPNWSQITMLENLRRENSTLAASLLFIPAQFIVVGPVLACVWLPGLRRLLRHPHGRPLGVAYVVLLVIYTLAGAKPYYLAGMYFILFAGGGLYVEERLATGRPGALSARIVASVAGAVGALPLVLPVLPSSALATGPWEGAINEDLNATVGWQELTRQVAGIASRLPVPERKRLVIYTGDYGAAGAIDLYGHKYRLPEAISGHNSFWWWGPAGAPNRSTTIAVNLPRSYLLSIFTHVQLAGKKATPHDVWSEERGDPIWICTGQRKTWAEAWPAARHYG